MRRVKARPKAVALSKAGMAVFAVGLLAIAVNIALFASGSRNLPLWLNLLAVLAPIGLGLGLLGLLQENRRARRRREERARIDGSEGSPPPAE